MRKRKFLRPARRRAARKFLNQRFWFQVNVCPECGEPGKHWVDMAGMGFSPTFANPAFLMPALSKLVHGFWMCNKFYGPDGRRIIESELF